jgi:hypothetical protein
MSKDFGRRSWSNRIKREKERNTFHCVLCPSEAFSLALFELNLDAFFYSRDYRQSSHLVNGGKLDKAAEVLQMNSYET